MTASSPWGGAASPPPSYANGRDPAFGFVRADGSRFAAGAGGAPFYFLGANYWAGMSLGASGASGDRERLRADLDAMAGLLLG